jgi:SAM-dependent methyltransferase
MPSFNQNRQYHSSCPVCGNNDLRYKYIVNNFTLVRCRACGLMFVKEKCSQEELDFYYKAGEVISADEDCVYLNLENTENLKYYFRNLRSGILGKVSTGKILDIGCNAGQFLDEMEGFERYGIERSPTHGKIAKEKYGENIFIGTFEDYPAPNFLFDCVTLQDVLDHMVDPLKALKKCHQLLRPGGLLVIKVHDMSSWFAKIMGRKFYAVIPPMHLFYFSRTALALAIKKASFETVFLGHLGHMIFLRTIFFRLAQNRKDSVFFKLYKLLDKTKLGRKKIYKNLHDIVTVLAVKK